ncbi:MAG: hypothetical protein OMM_04901 [Candidatus Magnetoglobus multicellularis str. Araruama]|uniref:Uncharacterized protein n=1 Tax=Candidatus Magnetoglobus multicellularis str. Araruama TaxID=890399 RepID=A0A1V1NZ90_9BACT|nr:MAG: hypothetical protein OMM_04901 [Candidatus Magnetoglobus multicellularis str. Araruama]
MAIDDKYIIVGAYGDSTNGRLSGSAYVFHLKDGIWEQCVFLKASDGDANDKFGSSVCIAETGDAIIGAFGHDAKGSQSGAAYIYSVFAMQASIQTTVPQGLIRSQVQVVDNFSSQPYHKQKHQSQGHYIQQPVETKKFPKKLPFTTHIFLNGETGSKILKVKLTVLLIWIPCISQHTFSKMANGH